jgi:EAL domain-containing protein (putative c-di-GMP-specific phosphodiesterase class I)
VFHEAADVGLGVELELLAVERALAALRAVPGYVAVNFSPAALFAREAQEILHRAPAHRVVVELSEHDPVEDYEALRSALAPHRARGVRLAIDDVGAGFSSLRHIVVTAPDVIKLDRSIVAGIGADPVLATVARSLVELARGLGAAVVAEGIETVADAVALRDAGVGLGQGWLFARAGAPADLRDHYPIEGLHRIGIPGLDGVAAPRAPGGISGADPRRW